MVEKIEVGYRPVTPGAYHKYIVYTNSTGKQYVTSAWPINEKITTASATYDANHFDHPLYPDNFYSHRYEDIKIGDDLSSNWQKIKDSMDSIAREGHKYDLLNQKSNTTADEALRRAGLPEPQYDGFLDVWAPGSGNNLPGGSDDTADGGNSGTSSSGGTGGGGGASGAGGGTPGNEGDTGGGAYGGPGSGGAGSGAAGTTLPRRDPIVFDLDGDGIETTSTRDGIVILFDHDGDSVKTGTGWIKPDDGWLVLDRNGNGVIDSGRELFGVDTL